MNMRNVLSIVALLALAVTLLAFESPAVRSAAPPPPGKVTYSPGKKAPVVFRHATHTRARCATCHPKPFEKVSHATKFTMDDISAGRACGSCHNGRDAFAVRSCTRCHVAGSAVKASKPGCSGDCGSCKGCPGK